MSAASGFSGVFSPFGGSRSVGARDPLLFDRAAPEPSQREATHGAWGPHAVWCEVDSVSVGWCGEIYNAQSLCRELGLPSETPIASIVLAAWQRWSSGLLSRLEGVFALVLQQADDLLLYRDPSGLRNLYFDTRGGGQFGFTTDLASGFIRGSTKPRLARQSLHEYLRFLEIAPPNTLFEKVTAVEAGQALRCSALGIERLLLTSLRATEPEHSRFSAAVDALEAHMQRSVQVCLEGSSSPAVFLSGGIDSALLSAIAARQRSDLTAVTVGFEGAAYDETPVAQRIASHLGIAHEVLRFSRKQFLGAFDLLSREADQPMADPAAMATLLAFDHCRQRFDVVLDGTGADEAVGTMPPRHMRVAVGQATLLPRGVRHCAARMLRAIPGLSGYAQVFDFDHPADTMSRWHGFTRMEIEELCGERVSLEHTQFINTFHRYTRWAHFERYSALMNAMTCDRLNQALVISSATVRFPFWDANTERFLRRLRIDHRYLPGQPKRILRALLGRYVPTILWDLPKHGFNFPLHEFLAGDDFHLVQRHLAPEVWREYGLLNVQQVQDLARQFMTGDQQVTFRVWALVVLGAWLQQRKNRVDLSEC